MTVVSDPSNYQFVGFEKSKSRNKKYDAILVNKKTGKERRVSFGDKRYEQYQDQALGLYSRLNHLDKKRRELYRKRHSGEQLKKYSSGWFSYRFLW